MGKAIQWAYHAEEDASLGDNAVFLKRDSKITYGGDLPIAPNGTHI